MREIRESVGVGSVSSASFRVSFIRSLRAKFLITALCVCFSRPAAVGGWIGFGRGGVAYLNGGRSLRVNAKKEGKASRAKTGRMCACDCFVGLIYRRFLLVLRKRQHHFWPVQHWRKRAVSPSLESNFGSVSVACVASLPCVRARFFGRLRAAGSGFSGPGVWLC